ncbi:phage holin [Gallibacterium genomosp. 1]|uniref:phage holin n=1 Tax=Gallibacterium genomosp. 1 TaxID=155515 RepID=UPI0006892F96|nr:phage holin [Gallibacterium genomosp. 1]
MKDSTTYAYWGAVLSFFSGLSINEWASLIGIGLGIATFLVNWYFKNEELKLKLKKQQYDEESH